MKPAKSKSFLKQVIVSHKLQEDNWLDILSEVSRIANSTIELEPRLNSIVEVITRQTGANACSILLMDEESGDLILRATKGLNPMSVNRVRLKVGEGITGWAAKERKPIALKNASSDPRFVYFPETEEEKFKSVLAVPILDKNDCIGVIYTQSVSERDYTENDIKLLLTIANQVSGIIKNAQLYDKAIQRLRELSILYEVSMAMQTTVNLDRLLRIILSSITVGNVFGFNRAALFLTNERTNTLQGMMGLGPDSGDEAREIWSKIAEITDLSRWLISQGDVLLKRESNFDGFIKSIRIPINPENGILALTVLEGKSFNIKDARNDPRTNKELLNKYGVISFAVVPIIARDHVLGIIVVDNIYTNKPITEEDVQSLVRFTSYAGLAIENAKIVTKLREANKEILSTQKRLIQSERLSALGELAAELAHEIKNPLVTIGGFARRFYEKSELNLEEKNYSHIIIKEVERLEKLLKDILNYSRDIKPNFSEYDINLLIENLLSIYERTFRDSGIEIKKELSKEISHINIDQPQINQVLINIFYNAVESMMDKGGVMSVKTEPLAEEEGVVIKISDTGGGIPVKILDNIFNPFFTTKKNGTGLGLSLSRKIVESHGGTIEIDNRIGEGAIFIVNLPRKGENRDRYHY